ncbi:hypothetical protein SAMD00020551_3399 [Mesobacillus selenatarsenatis SF-1]|uniref:Uncharacterized protein n=1 Tax=Mesobacillus selenatarsenatis (strain DSM 18680 / JCM 14380 / FERM P-15431 / SF-1) TaxID=1321606 RepID=A0A0A8X5M3_MESS1|nr:hypothetical protein SAMD00020551_3399 [Mesobacillus selenatarsenatis SF-1]
MKIANKVVKIANKNIKRTKKGMKLIENWLFTSNRLNFRSMGRFPLQEISIVMSKTPQNYLFYQSTEKYIIDSHTTFTNIKKILRFMLSEY